jgi:peptide subunit release factor 1 (eRF1)
MKREDVSDLFARPARKRECVLSVYLHVDQSQRVNLNRGFETQFKEMASSFRKSLKEGPDRDGSAAAIHRAGNFVSAYTPEGRGLAVFLDESDGFFSYKQLPFPVTNQIRWSHELFLQPFADAIDELEDYGVVMVDRTKLRVFLVQQCKIDELLYEESQGRRTRHVKSTGPDHAESSARNQRRADNQIHANLKEAGRQVIEIVKAKRLHRLVLAGTPEITAELRLVLPERITQGIMGDVKLAITASAAEVLAATQPVANAYERSTEMEKVNDIVSAASKKGKAVIGLGHTLQAINARRVWELVYSAGAQAPGFECSGCSALFSLETPSCPLCNANVRSVNNVIERAVEHALRDEAKVEVVTGEASAALDSAGGIGAFLKTRTKAVLAG